MMAKGTFGHIIVATADLDGAFGGCKPGAPKSSRSRPSSRGFAITRSAIPRAT